MHLRACASEYTCVFACTCSVQVDVCLAACLLVCVHAPTNTASCSSGLWVTSQYPSLSQVSQVACCCQPRAAVSCLAGTWRSMSTPMVTLKLALPQLSYLSFHLSPAPSSCSQTENIPLSILLLPLSHRLSLNNVIFLLLVSEKHPPALSYFFDWNN